MWNIFITTLEDRPVFTECMICGKNSSLCDHSVQHGDGLIREFETGATRDTAAGKFEYAGYLSPYFINAFGRYMNNHQQLPDGSRRACDNWQKGIPMDVYQHSMWRHFFDTWAVLRGCDVVDENGKSVDLIESIMGLVFNLQGIVHETLKGNPIQRGA